VSRPVCRRSTASSLGVRGFGNFPMMNSVDIDAFYEWACWSGTSFSGPVVVATLAREMVIGNCDAGEAARRVVRAPHLMRFPCLGTVVNL
jgi:hypothetical protein